MKYWDTFWEVMLFLLATVVVVRAVLYEPRPPRPYVPTVPSPVQELPDDEIEPLQSQEAKA